MNALLAFGMLFSVANGANIQISEYQALISGTRLQSLVSGKRVFAVASPRFIALGNIRRTSWSPSNSIVAIEFDPTTEAPITEANRLKNGQILKESQFASFAHYQIETVKLQSIVLYTLETGKTVRVVPAWDPSVEIVEKFGWIDATTLLVQTAPLMLTADVRTIFYIYDAISGALVNSFRSPFSCLGCNTPSEGLGSQLVLSYAKSGETTATLHTLSRTGLSKPIVTAKSIFGGFESADGTGIIWSVDGDRAIYRQVNGRLESSPITQSDMSASSDRYDRLSHGVKGKREPRLTVTSLGPSLTSQLSLRASTPAPLQPDEIYVGTGMSNEPTIGSFGMVYGLDGVILGRYMVELVGATAERALDQAERVTIERWALQVVKEFRSWTNGFSEAPDPFKFPVTEIGSFQQFADRLNWIGSKTRLFEIKGERFTATFDENRIGTYLRRNR